MNSRIEKFLSLRSLPFLAMLAALALTLPSVWTGWQQDDLIQRYYFLGNPEVGGREPSVLNLFSFLDGDTTRAIALMDKGVLPWWTLPTVRLSFWRPLTALTHGLDYLLWPQNSVLMHIQSLLWFAGLILAAGALYRRFLGGGWIAGLAILFFALDDTHGLPAGWLAGRNALIAGFFGILVLIAHDRWRRDRWSAGAVAGPLLLLLGLLSGEAGVAACGYLFAYALFIDRASPRNRVLSLLPYAVVALGWLIVYSALGHGTWGSGFYVDPMTEPMQFLKAVVWKSPLLLTDQWLLPPSFVALFASKDLLLGLWLWSLVALSLVAFLLVPLIRHDRVARFWVTGMLLSIPAVCSTVPHGRLLLFAGIGAFGVLAQWMGAMAMKPEWIPRTKGWRRTARPMVYVFLVVHLLIAPILLPMNATSASFAQMYIQDPIKKVPAGPEFKSQELVILNHPIVFYADYFLTVRLLNGLPGPRILRVLAPGLTPVHVYRPDDSTLVVRPEGGFFAAPFDDVFRGPSHLLTKGEVIRLTGMTAEITDVLPDGRPAAVEFRFPVPLTDPSLRWLQWKDNQYESFTPPAVGERVTIPGSPIAL
jgi:hypothetical protein